MEVHERVVVKGRIGRLTTPLIHEDFKGLHAYVDRHNRYSTWEAAVRRRFLETGRFGDEAVEARLFGNIQERRRWLKALVMRMPCEHWIWFWYHYGFRLGFLRGPPWPRRLPPACSLRGPGASQTLRIAGEGGILVRGPLLARRRPFRGPAVLFVAFLPILSAWAHKQLLHPRPFWIQYYDPETIYYHGGRDLLNHRVPNNLDNPGVPVHMLSAALLSLSGTAPSSYEVFLSLAHVLSLVATLGALAVLMRHLMCGLSPALQIAGLWAFFCCPQAFEYLDVWSPEERFYSFGCRFT